MTKLSIITINLNNSNGLRNTINSVLSQTFLDFEYIIIDGGSTDASLDVIRENKNRINHYISEPDKGIYNAMNKGLKLVNNDYVLFLNSGDCLADVDVLSKIMNDIKADNITDIFYGNMYHVQKKKVFTYPNKINLEYLYFNSLSHQSTVYKRNIFDNLGFFNEQFGIISDWILNFESALLGYKFKKLNYLVSYFEGFGIGEKKGLIFTERNIYRQLKFTLIQDYLIQNNQKRNSLKNNLYLLKRSLNNYILRFLKSKKSSFLNFNVLNSIDTINLILRNKTIVGVCRFGDGELEIIKGNSTNFQDYSYDLRLRLMEVLKSQRPDILVCIPSLISPDLNFKTKAQKFWINHFRNNYYVWNDFLNHNNMYGNSLFTRPYMDYKLVSDEYFKNYFLQLSRIWNGYHVLIIEGFGTRFGYGNDLLDNALSIRRIICPSRNAFQFYIKILESAKLFSKNCKVLISLGMTATILAYDLAILGIPSYDIGHLDLEYEWYLKRAKNKIKIDNKSVNELNVNIDSDVNDVIYLNQIVDRIG